MTSLESILDEQLEKLNHINLVTTLLQAKYNIQPELRDLSKNLIKIEQLQKDASAELEETKNLILELNSLIPLLIETQEDWDDFNGNSEVQACLEKINQQKNKPREILPTQTAPKEDEKNQNQLRPSIKTENSSCQNPTGIFIPLLSNEEFEMIPKYIIGRNTLAVLNSFVSTLNEILEEKYSFLAEGRLKAKKKNKIDKFLYYKSQESAVKENPKGNDVYFFVEEDYKNFTQSKLDKIKLTFLTALRHVKRIEFIRIAKDMYYAVEKR